MLTAILIVAYVPGFLWATRAAAQFLMPSYTYYEPDGTDYGLSLFGGMAAATLWPVWVLPVLAYRKWGVSPLRAVVGEPHDRKIRRLEREAREQEEHIRRLEREAGLV